MKKTVVPVLVFILLIISYNLGFCFEGINPEQPISIGEVIYYDGKMTNDSGITWLDYVEYTYSGVENNSLKIEVKKQSTLSSESKEEVSEINLPLNNNKQTILKVKPPMKTLREVELLITVADEFYRIKVKEFNKK